MKERERGGRQKTRKRTIESGSFLLATASGRRERKREKKQERERYEARESCSDGEWKKR